MLVSNSVFAEQHQSQQTHHKHPRAHHNGKHHHTPPRRVSRKPQPMPKQLYNLKQVDIRMVINQVAKETGKNFIVDPRVKGEVTMMSHAPLSPDELYQVFLALLQVHGYTAITSGKAVKIIPIRESKTEATPFVRSYFQLMGNHVVVRVLHARYVPVTELVKAMKPLVPKTSHIAAYQPSNDIIVADTAQNIKRLASLLRELDRPSDETTQVIRLRYASADAVASAIANTLPQAATNRRLKNAKQQAAISVDERTNSVIISGDRSQRFHMRQVIAKLDVRVSNSNNTQVIYLKFIRAEDIAPILANIIASYTDKNSYEGQQRKNLEPAPVVNGGRRNATNGKTNNNIVQQNTLSRGVNYGPSVTRFQDPAAIAATDDGRIKSGSVGPNVQWEETTNAVIVKAPIAAMRAVRTVIAKLDIRRPQVLVETIIAEVNLQRAHSLGVEWNTPGDVKVGTRFPQGGLSTITGPLGGSGTVGTAGSDTNNVLQNIAQSFVPGSGLTVGFFRNGNLHGLIRAIGNDGASNILATPNIVTLDNETANIRVGQLVPFAVGQSNNEDKGGLPFTSFDREEVGLSLTIRPQITSSGAIRLFINHILSNIIEGSASLGTGDNPTTSERVITTNVLVDTNETLVLGGLIQNEWEYNTAKVPILGDLPVLGALFRSRTRQRVKRNLMIFLHPIILRNKWDGIRVSGAKYNNLRQQQLDSERLPFNWMPKQSVVLPHLQGPPTIPKPFSMMATTWWSKHPHRI